MPPQSSPLTQSPTTTISFHLPSTILSHPPTKQIHVNHIHRHQTITTHLFKEWWRQNRIIIRSTGCYDVYSLLLCVVRGWSGEMVFGKVLKVTSVWLFFGMGGLVLMHFDVQAWWRSFWIFVGHTSKQFTDIFDRLCIQIKVFTKYS